MEVPENTKIGETNFITLGITDEKGEKTEGLITFTVKRPFDTKLVWASETKQGREADTGDVAIFSKTKGAEVISVNVINNEIIDLQGVLKLNLPKDWTSVPETLDINLSGNKSSEYKFTVKYPENTSNGRYLFSGSFTAKGTENQIEPIAIRIGSNKLIRAENKVKIITDSVFQDDPGAKYSIVPLNDGVVDVEGVSYYNAAWASDENKNGHWIEVDFPEKTEINEIYIFWNYEHKYYSAKKFFIEKYENGNWVKIKEVINEKDQIDYNKIEIPKTQVEKIRIFQPVDAGSVFRTNLMWVREVEMY
jgi:hypothetical protein